MYCEVAGNQIQGVLKASWISPLAQLIGQTGVLILQLPSDSQERLDDNQESLETTGKTVDIWERPILWVYCVSISAHKPF